MFENLFPSKAGADSISEGDASDRGARFVAGFDQGSLEGFCVGATDTAGLRDVHESVH